MKKVLCGVLIATSSIIVYECLRRQGIIDKACQCIKEQCQVKVS